MDCKQLKLFKIVAGGATLASCHRMVVQPPPNPPMPPPAPPAPPTFSPLPEFFAMFVTDGYTNVLSIIQTSIKKHVIIEGLA